MSNKVLENLNVKELSGKNGLVVYFFPKALSGPCSLEAHEFNNHLDDFKKLGFNVVGVSLDKVKKNDKFSQRDDLKFPLVSDTNEEITKKYSKVTNLKLGKMGIPFTKGADRTIIVLDPNGKELVNVDSIGNKKDTIKETVDKLLDKLGHLTK